MTIKRPCLNVPNKWCSVPNYCDRSGCIEQWQLDRENSWNNCSERTDLCVKNECKKGCKNDA